MENFSLFPLIFQSVPEAIILISTSLVLFGYNVRETFKKIVLIATFNSLMLMLIRAYFPFGFHTFWGLIILSLSLWKIFKINLVKSFTISAFGIVLLGVLESLFTPIWLQLFNLNMNEILNHSVLRIVITYPHLLVLSLIGFWAYKKKWYLVNLDSVIISRSNFVVIIVVLLHVLLLIFFNLDKYFFQVGFFKKSLPFINVFFVISLILSIILVKKLFAMAENEALMQLEEQHFKNVDDLFDSYRAQRHDFNNHIQTLYGMIAATKHVEAISYLDSLLDDSDELNELIRLKHSALAALLKAKVVIAKSKDIDFQILIKASLENIKIKPHEVVNIMGNLIDNAIEALENLAPGNRKLIFSITSSKGFFTFHVINSGIIKKEILDNIFEKHFTTKDQSKHSGIGLSTVKKLVIKNKGDIGVNSSPENGTVFTVILPAEE